jgi:hypothetical protein
MGVGRFLNAGLDLLCHLVLGPHVMTFSKCRVGPGYDLVVDGGHSQNVGLDQGITSP